MILAYVLDPVFRDSNANSKTFNEFYKSSNDSDSLDIIIVGSSHAKNAYFPKVIDSVFNTKTYNLSTGGQNYITTNLLLENAIKEAKPKLVIIDLFPTLIKLPKLAKSKGSQLRVIDYTPLSQRRVQTINKIYSFSELPSVYSETIRNHDKWYNRNWSLNEFPVNNENVIFYKGYFNLKKKIGNQEKEKYKDFIVEYENYLKVIPSKKELENFEVNYSDILETIKICKKNNVKMLFVSAPYFDAFFRDENNKKHYLLNRYFKNQKEINYIDFNTKFNELGLTFEDYWDKGHLNVNGSYKTSIMLAKKIADFGFFEVKNPVYFKKELEKVVPRKTENIKEKVTLSITKQIENTLKKGVSYKTNHKLNKDISLNDVVFNIDESNRYIVIEYTQTINDSILDDFYFLISKTINKADFDKRPKWQLGTEKNKLHWEVYPRLITINDKNYMLLMLDKKCQITNFDKIRIVLKDKKTKKSVSGAKPLTLENVRIIK